MPIIEEYNRIAIPRLATTIRMSHIADRVGQYILDLEGNIFDQIKLANRALSLLRYKCTSPQIMEMQINLWRFLLYSFEDHLPKEGYSARSQLISWKSV